MEQKKLYKTIEDFFKAAPQFRSDVELLTYALKEIIDTEQIEIIGGRIWKLSPDKGSYLLVSQMGEVDVIEENYMLPVAQYPMFKEVGRYRSVVAKETDEYLIKKGIYHYSATGVGERYRIKPDSGEPFFLYQYLIAFNTRVREEDVFLDTLNIVSTTLSSILRSKSIESSAKENIVELEKAREIQKNILPEHEFKFGGFEIFGVSIPEKIVGGDFFDYITSTDRDILGVAIGDAASKGISAAAQALYVSGALRMGVEFDIRMSSLVKKINSLVYDTFPYERFVTLFYCELFNDQKGLCLYVNAGHNRPLMLKAQADRVEQLMTTGPVLGPSPNQSYTYESTRFGVNDIMIMFTDGIVEAVNKNFDFYGEERLQEVLLKNKDKAPREICELIIEDVQIFSAEGDYADDKTLVVIKRVK